MEVNLINLINNYLIMLFVDFFLYENNQLDDVIKRVLKFNVDANL